MKLRRSRNLDVLRPMVTPDPTAAEALERRIAELSYQPENGFHKDRQQPRLDQSALVQKPQ